MKVFITGATGLVGAHTAKELLKSGHQIKLLVRNKALAKHYFHQHGLSVDEFIEGDMTNRELVKTSLDDCDAVLHSAAMVSLDPKKANEVYRSNIASIDSVIGSAHELGIKNILYVSSLGALFNPQAKFINERAPLGFPRDAYSKSKRDCEYYIRNMQSTGVPVQVTYPSGVFGPYDPKLNESNHSLITLLKVIPNTSSGIQCVDARDLAKVHRLMLENPPTSDFQQARYIVAGHYYPWQAFHQLLTQITGRYILNPTVPGVAMRLLGNLMEAVKQIYPLSLPITRESMAIATQWPIADSQKVIDSFDIQFRPGIETFTDTIRWLHQQQHLKPYWAGQLAIYSG